MNHPEVMEAPRAEPDFEAQDEMAEWAVENAERLMAADVEKMAQRARQSGSIPNIQ